jgi:predicted aspartyl protease
MSTDTLIIEADGAADDDLLLTEYDFPEEYVNMAHPDDGTIQAEPIVPQYFRHSRRGRFRMLVRISVRLDETSFAPYTFVCDTGAPMHLYLSESARGALEKAGRIEYDEVGSPIIEIGGRKAAVRVTPHTHQPANIMGMLMLERFGLQMSEGSFKFNTAPDYL